MKRIAWAAALLPILAVLAGCGSSGSNGQSEGLETSFRAPASYSLPQLEHQQYPCGKENENCAISYLRKLTTRYGPQASLGVLDAVERGGNIDPAFDTHQLAHLVGEATAKTVRCEQAGVRPLPADLQLRLRPRLLHLRARPQRVADEGGEDDLRLGRAGPLVPTFNCWHGVGHGVMMARGNDLRASLDVCDSLGSGSAADGCWQGVFMENINAVFRDQARPGVFSPAHPLRPCTRMLERVQAGVLHQPGRLARASGQRQHRQGRSLLPGRGEVRLRLRPEHRTDGHEPELAAPLLRLCQRRVVRADRLGSLLAFPHAAPARLRARRCRQPRQLRPVEREALGRLLRADRSAAEDVLPGDRCQPDPADDGRSRWRARAARSSQRTQADCIAGITQGQLPAAPIKVPAAKPEKPPAEATGKASATVRMTDQRLLAQGSEDQAGPDGRVRQRQQRRTTGPRQIRTRSTPTIPGSTRGRASTRANPGSSPSTASAATATTTT